MKRGCRAAPSDIAPLHLPFLLRFSPEIVGVAVADAGFFLFVFSFRLRRESSILHFFLERSDSILKAVCFCIKLGTIVLLFGLELLLSINAVGVGCGKAVNFHIGDDALRLGFGHCLWFDIFSRLFLVTSRHGKEKKREEKDFLFHDV